MGDRDVLITSWVDSCLLHLLGFFVKLSLVVFRLLDDLILLLQGLSIGSLLSDFSH